MWQATSSVAVMRGRVQLGLLVDRERCDVLLVERMVAGEMQQIRHPFDTGLGHVDRFEPNPQLVGVQAAEPFAGRTTVTGTAGRAGPMVREIVVGDRFRRFTRRRPRRVPRPARSLDRDSRCARRTPRR